MRCDRRRHAHPLNNNRLVVPHPLPPVLEQEELPRELRAAVAEPERPERHHHHDELWQGVRLVRPGEDLLKQEAVLVELSPYEVEYICSRDDVVWRWRWRWRWRWHALPGLP